MFNNYRSTAEAIKHWTWIWMDLRHVWFIKDVNS